MVAMRWAAMIAMLGGCGLDMGATHPWVSAADVSGPLAPEQVTVVPFANRLIATDPLRVVTYNVEYGPDPEGAARALLDTPALAQAGVVLVQEIEAHPGEAASRAARMAAVLGFEYVYVPARTLPDGGTHGLAILSAFPIGSVEKMDLADAVRKSQHRIAIRATLDLGGHELQLVDVHLDTKLDAQQRIAQLSPVITGSPDAQLVAGDFNTSWIEWVGGTIPVLSSVGATDQAAVVQDYMDQQAFAAPTADSGPTERMYGIEQRLDAIYTRDVAATFGGVERVGPSDHWPMWIDVAPQ
jgi:endonuclease/exonuclease/phosphatase family metal-dependent hydrolase